MGEDNRAPFLSGLNNWNINIWLKHDKPFSNKRCGSWLWRLFEVAGIVSAKQAAQKLGGIASSSTIYRWKDNPAVISWEKFDAVCECLYRLCELNDKQMLSRGATEEFLDELSSIATIEADEEVRHADRELKLARINGIAQQLTAADLSTLLDVAIALICAQR